MWVKALISGAVFGVVMTASAAPFSDMPGSVPLKYERQASSDLVYQGKVLLPDEARALYESGRISDLSKLNPDSTSDLWKDRMGGNAVDDLSLMDLKATGETVEYISDTEVPVGRMAFIAQKRTSTGETRAYQFRLDVKGHNILLRKAMLRKIGYEIPLTDRVATLKVRFKSSFEKSEFIRQITKMTFIEAERWVTSPLEEDSDTLTLQDVIVMDGANDTIFNLARGSLSESTIQGRRLFNALLVPYSLSDAPESLNLLPWNTARIFNDQAYLSYEDANSFSTSYEDARWILRRLLKLSRQDWVQIVASARVPSEVSAVWLEKLLYARNDLLKTFGFAKEFSLLPVNQEITVGSRLAKGKLSGPDWKGYGRHFAGIDPDSPLSRQEMVGLVKSKALSNLIANLVAEFNLYMPATDLAYARFDRQLDLSAQQFAHYIATKEIKPIPRGIWTKSFFNTNISARRDTISGTYMGTENIVQLADSIDMGLDLGVYYMGEGLPDKLMIDGKLKMAFVKTYTHIKPLTSINLGLKEPFRNLMVPYFKKQATTPLQDILKLEPKKDISEEELAELNGKVKVEMDAFNKQFGKGESLIVTTALGPDASMTIGRGLTKDIQAYIELKDRLTDLSRTQIYRKDDKTVQLYFDPSLYNVFSLSFGMRAQIPIIEFGWDIAKGMVSTYFFEFNIDPDLEKNPEFFDNVRNVSAALSGASIKYFKNQKKPWEVKHKFTDSKTRLDFLIWKYQKASTTDMIRVQHPQGQSADFIRRSKGYRNGVDYQTLILQVTTALIREKYPTSAGISSAGNGNPADTIGGKAVTRMVNVEAELTPTGVRAENLFASVSYGWKGWTIKKPEADKIIEEVRTMFGRELFRKPVLNNTEKIQFYNIDVQVALYEQAVKNIEKLKPDEVALIFERHAKKLNYDQSQSNGWVNAINQDIKELKKLRELARKDPKARVEIINRLTEILEVAESQLTFDGLKQMSGGIQNLFVRGTIRGFRVGAENGNQDIQSDTLGQIGAYEPQGPLVTLQRNMGISGGEFFITWLLNPL